MTRWNSPGQSQSATATFNPWIIPQLAGEIVRSLVLSGIDPAIAIIAVLACVSLLTQGVANVAWPNGLPIPIGTSELLVAPSGWGKSLVLRILTDWIHPYVEQRLTAGLERKPLFFIEDATREAVILHLVEWNVAGLFSDEAGQLKGLLRNGAPALAKLMDGSPLRHARVSCGRAELLGHRLTVLAMMQPEVFQDMKALLGAQKGGVGLVNRMLVGRAGAPPSPAALSSLGLSPVVRAGYEERGALLLDKTIELVLKREARPTLHLAAGAERRLIDVMGEVASTRRDPKVGDVSEYASRHAERVLRLAGAFHVFNHGPTGEVQVESVEAAHQVGLWSIDTYGELTTVPPKPTQSEQDAARVEDALNKVAFRYGPRLPLSSLRRMSPNIGLTKARFDRALPLLAGAGKIELFMQEGAEMVFVNQPSARWLSFNSR